MRRGALLTLALAAAAWPGCAPPKRPAELGSLERRWARRRDLAAPETTRLLHAARRERRRSIAAWQDSDLPLSRHFAKLASARLRAAGAIVARLQAQKQLKQLMAKLTLARSDHRHLRERLEDLDEQVRVYEDLAKALLDKHFKALELSAAQKLIKAQRLIDAAQAAVHGATTVDAAKHSPLAFKLANELIGAATGLLRAKHPDKAIKTAELAKKKADEAYTKARAKYVKLKLAAQLHKRNEQLRQAAAAIKGVKPKLETKATTHRLVLTVPSLFPRGSDRLRTNKLDALTAIAKLLKQYPDFPVIIAGYTSASVKRGKRFELSRYRAYRVVHYFQTFKLPYKRFAVQAHGGRNRIARAFSNVNDRVDIVLLLHAEK